MIEKDDDFISWLERIYFLEAPGQSSYEDHIGHYYPYPISEIGIEFIPLPEPHALITDWYNDPQDWYHIRNLIDEFARQSFVCYHKGLFFASTAASISCIELILKYECLRNAKEPKDPRALEENWTLGTAIKDCRDKGLFLEFDTKLNLINTVRNGIFHFNPVKLRKVMIAIRKDIDESNSADKPDSGIKNMGLVYKDGIGYLVELSDLPPEDPLMNLTNIEWSVIAYYSYELMNEIGCSIYGIEKKIGCLRECLDDYSRINRLSKRLSQN